MNKAILVGRLTKTPEMRTTASGTNSTTFTLAVNREFTNQNGEKETDFVSCVAWNKPAEAIANYCTKGSLIGISGRIQTRSYDAQDGTKRYVTEVIVEKCTFLSSKSETPKVETKEPTDSEIVQAAMNGVDPFTEFANETALSDDELPF